MNSGKLLTATAIALALGSSMSIGAFAAGPNAPLKIAQAQPANIEVTIAAYLQAKADLEAAKNGTGDVGAAEDKLNKVTAELEGLCVILGQTEVEKCIEAVTGTAVPAPAADQPAKAAEPAPLPAAAAAAIEPPAALLKAVDDYEKANAALSAAVDAGADAAGAQADATRTKEVIDGLCTQIGQTDTAVCLDQFGLKLTPMVAIAVSAEQTPPAADAQPAAKVESQPTEKPADAVVQAEPAKEPAKEPVKAEVKAEPVDGQANVDNPSGAPLPRELSLAVATYEQANTQLANAVTGTPEADAAQAAVKAAADDIQRICEQEGQGDLEACLAGFGIALSPIATAMQAPTKAEVVAPQEVAPILDSAKDAKVEAEAKRSAVPLQTEQAPAEQPKTEQPKTEQPAAEQPIAQQSVAPTSDAAAQLGAVPETIPSIESTKGTRLAASPMLDRPADAKVVEQSGLRIVLQFNNQLIISNPSDQRLAYGATERYVEELPRGRTRETIIRPDGIRLVTVYNRNGDILHRSRFDQDGYETVLSYIPDNYDENLLTWRDPGLDLPPLQLNIPAQDYVLDADRANLDGLTRFLDRPPVEQVRRLYSIDEVKRSARVRDMVRRLEIGNLAFETGSSTIPPDQISALSIVANAMLDLIDQNPAETFLIEGHTDAIGSDLSNLILSDRRAETVAVALTQVFGIPPENLATQGYGERYLKINTQAAERLNRRVTIRRITPLVVPVAKNNR